jgi:hypothetical protein
MQSCSRVFGAETRVRSLPASAGGPTNTRGYDLGMRKPRAADAPSLSALKPILLGRLRLAYAGAFDAKSKDQILLALDAKSMDQIK